ncbi:homeobox protein knotted-1-like 3 isoform X1 [Cucurbita pepo subsp. pepo]|uniref:homeobox protein knotted-1-like 3 isoform X1 n=2 Tax=Cucurbita pepo subsp. pepo TaxID=3664 RepID=UPI000C9D4AAE|nr:homeobox protein knotted-1-like 3 isoform X1 [Cucurbita pepo subsp. pepo]
MAFRDQLSRGLPLHYGNQPPEEQSERPLDSTLRSILSDQLTDHSPAGDGSKSEHLLQSTPNWLNSALLRNQTPHSQYSGDSMTSAADKDITDFLNLHTTGSNSAVSHPTGQWLSRPILHRNHSDVIDEVADAADAMIGATTTLSRESDDLKNNSCGGGGEGVNNSDDVAIESDGNEGAHCEEAAVNWQNARAKAEILAHPLYEQLLSAHVACLRIATPVDQLPRIDSQLAESQNVAAKYSSLGHGSQPVVGNGKEIDQFMTHYVLLLCSFKEQLQQHVRFHAMEAVYACWEIEQSLQSLTGVSPGEGTGATMSDDEEDQIDSDAIMFDGCLEGHDATGFGPLIPTESEKSLMERVRHELKHELKNGYKEKIVDIREEILRKRRAGKLPGGTTSVLKAWWQSHSKWPYPTEEDKAKLVQETGLQLKQINNWFINQRKRNWHANPSTTTTMKTKRKRSNAGDTPGDDHE